MYTYRFILPQMLNIYNNQFLSLPASSHKHGVDQVCGVGG